ncbi:MAG: hypothetical protein RBG13Loki_4060 [Promethearchaeota archaeon CR_4]|nr:MAG: hypothetical protein RBG13Loki_4060 [Candidatus Lokiarchaeota archaeon CR_4]
MSTDENARIKVVKTGDKEIKVRMLTELRQDTTDKAQKAMESRIAYFDAKRDVPFQDKVETGVAKVVSIVAEIAQNVRKMIPEQTQAKLIEYWEKILLAF